MRWMFQGPGVQVVPLVPSVGPVPPPIWVVIPFESAEIRLLRRNHMDMTVDPASGGDLALAGDDFCVG